MDTDIQAEADQLSFFSILSHLLAELSKIDERHKQAVQSAISASLAELTLEIDHPRVPEKTEMFVEARNTVLAMNRLVSPP